jgi:hypothetical protein
MLSPFPGMDPYLEDPVRLQRRLPRFRVSLREPDPDVALNLPAVFAQCYDNGGHADFVVYGQPAPGVALARGRGVDGRFAKRGGVT